MEGHIPVGNAQSSVIRVAWESRGRQEEVKLHVVRINSVNSDNFSILHDWSNDPS